MDFLFTLYEVVSGQLAGASLGEQRNVEIRAENVQISPAHQLQTLSRRVLDTIANVIRTDVQQGVTQQQHRLTYWILYLRSVALGLGKPHTAADIMSSGAGSGASDTAGTSGAGDDGEDGEEGMTASANATSVDQAAIDVVPKVSLTQITSTSQLTTVYREVLLKTCPYFAFGRLEIKVFALKLACELLQTYLPQQQEEAKRVADATLARQTVNAELTLLRQQSATNSNEECTVEIFLRLPMPIVLYLNDLVSFGCSAATYTLNDKTVPVLQEHGMELLSQICRVFIHTIDPDYQSQGDSAVDALESKLLLQFLSQLSGALRTCLTARHAPTLMLHTGHILQLLLSQGFIRDKVALKRLLKPLSTFFESSVVSAEVPRPLNTSVHDQIATEEVLRFFVLAAQCKLLSIAAAGTTSLVDQGVRTALAAFIAEFGGKFRGLLHAILIDAIRLLQSSPTETIADEFDNHSNGNNNDDDCHALRGGLTYPPTVHAYALRPALMQAAVVAAQVLAQDGQVRSQFGSDILSLLVIFIENLCHSVVTANENKSSAVVVRKDDILVVISQLCAPQSGSSATSLSCEHLLSLLELVERLETPQQPSQSAKININNLLARMVMQILNTASSSGTTSEEVLQSAWKTLIRRTQRLFPSLFEVTVSSSSSVQSSLALVAPSQAASQLFASWKTVASPSTSSEATVPEVEDMFASHQSTFPSTSGTVVAEIVEDSLVKDILLAWLVFASKSLAVPSLAGSVVYVTRLVGLLSLHYVSTAKSVLGNAAPLLLLETLVKAYGKLVSLLPSTQEVHQEINAVINLLWCTYQQVVKDPQNSQMVTDWETVLETQLLLWCTAVGTATPVFTQQVHNNVP